MGPRRPIQLAALMGLASLASLAWLAGCSSETHSCNLETSAIVLHATVTDGDEGIEIEIELALGEDDDDSIGTPLSLCSESGERLEVNGHPAKQVRVLGRTYYVVDFDAPESTYTIEYTRDEGTITAELMMPPTLAITMPSEDAEISRGEPLSISWDPSWPEHPIAIAVEDEIGSDCLEGLGYAIDLDDMGSATIAANQLEPGPDTAATCTAWIALTRTSEAAYPDELHEGGRIEGYVKRRLRFSSKG